jgi:hypothetical protein
MNEPIKVIQYKDHFIKIFQDQDYFSPRTFFDNLGTMVCWYKKYEIGDKHDFSSENFFRELATEIDPTIEERIEYWESGNGLKKLIDKHGHIKAYCIVEDNIQNIVSKVIENNVIYLPIHMYDHSGVTIRTTPFSCHWDSGQLGFIYVTKEKIKKEFQVKRVSKRLFKRVEEFLQAEVKIENDSLTGNVYGFVITDKEDEKIDSCWGFFGDYNKDCVPAAKNVIDNI